MTASTPSPDHTNNHINAAVLCVSINSSCVTCVKWGGPKSGPFQGRQAKEVNFPEASEASGGRANGFFFGSSRVNSEHIESPRHQRRHLTTQRTSREIHKFAFFCIQRPYGWSYRTDKIRGMDAVFRAVTSNGPLAGRCGPSGQDPCFTNVFSKAF